MAAVMKKEKLRKTGSSPLTGPRPTAASAARAACNATNRNIVTTQKSLDSKSFRGPFSPKVKTQPQKETFEDSLPATEPVQDLYPESFSTSGDTKEDPDLNVAAKEVSGEESEETKNDKEQTRKTWSRPTSQVTAGSASCKLTNRPRTTGQKNADSKFIRPPLSPKGDSKDDLDISTNNRISDTIDEGHDKNGLETEQKYNAPVKLISSHRTGIPGPASQHNCPNSPAHLERSNPNTPQASHRVSFRTESNSDLNESLDAELDLKEVFAAKQKKFHLLKKELDMKQQAFLEVFDNLQGLRKRMEKEGIQSMNEANIQELVLFNVCDWAGEEVAQLYYNAAANTNADGAIEIVNSLAHYDDSSLADLDEKVTNVPNRFADLCLQVFTARQEIIDWVKEELIQNKEFSLMSESGMEARNGDAVDRISRYNSQGLEFCDALQELKNFSDDVVETVKELSRHVIKERSTLVSVGESLVRETERLRYELKAHTEAIAELQLKRATSEEQRRTTEEATNKTSLPKDKLAQTEAALRQSRNRLLKMDKQLKETEACNVGLTATVKSIEEQSRQKEVQLENKARKWREMVKSTELVNNQLTVQKNNLEAELKNMQSQILEIQEQQQNTGKDYVNEIKGLKKTLDKLQKDLENEKTNCMEAEKKVAAGQAEIIDLNAKIAHLEKCRNNPELPTEKEINLWSELLATKDTLRLAEEEITACKKEKIRFLETLTKLTKCEDKIGLQQKLAAELVTKEEIINNMQIQIRELGKNLKHNEQKVIQYEEYVRDSRVAFSYTGDCQNEEDYENKLKEIRQEMMNLKMNLLDATHKNEQLSDILLKKEQQIEQQDRTSRAQAKVIKVREELISMLKNKEAEQSRELTTLQQDLQYRMKIVDEVNHQIASKAEEIKDLFVTLDSKQQQIYRLEKIVLALEEQQRRAQTQRTRHEEKIATLEHELALVGDRKERKFLFF